MDGLKTTDTLASAADHDLGHSSYVNLSTSAERGDHVDTDDQSPRVAAPFDGALDHTRRDSLAGYVESADPICGGQNSASANHTRLAATALCAEIREHYRSRQDFLNAEKRLTLQGRAICRRFTEGDVPASQKLFKAVINQTEHEHLHLATGAITPILEARKHIAAEKRRRERIITKLVKDLPAYQFVEQLHGFGAMGLGMIVGEAGPLDNYSNPAKLWKRMGLAVINGGRQRRVSGAEALEHGYCPERRAVMYVIGDALMKKPNDYRVLRDTRRAIEREKAEAAGLTVAPAAKIPKEKAELFMSEGHILNRSNRYIQKRLLKDLWRYWRAQNNG